VLLDRTRDPPELQLKSSAAAPPIEMVADTPLTTTDLAVGAAKASEARARAAKVVFISCSGFGLIGNWGVEELDADGSQNWMENQEAFPEAFIVG
jgi:hypothetical protein